MGFRSTFAGSSVENSPSGTRALQPRKPVGGGSREQHSLRFPAPSYSYLVAEILSGGLLGEALRDTSFHDLLSVPQQNLGFSQSTGSSGQKQTRQVNTLLQQHPSHSVIVLVGPLSRASL